MSGRERTARDRRRRELGQNFLRPEWAERVLSALDVRPGELVLEVGAGRGALTFRLAALGARVIAVEVDPAWASQLQAAGRGVRPGSIRVVAANFLNTDLPEAPFRVVASVPFSLTTRILHRLLDDPTSALSRADLVVQWEVGRKRAAAPAANLLSASWAPWWRFALVDRIPAAAFRPVPGVDAGLLRVTRRDPPLLPLVMAGPFASFIRERWPQ